MLGGAALVVSIIALVVSCDASKNAELTAYRTYIYSSRIDGLKEYPAAASKFELAIRKGMIDMPYNLRDPKIFDILTDEELRAAARKVEPVGDALMAFQSLSGDTYANWPPEVRSKIMTAYGAAGAAAACYLTLGARPDRLDAEWWAFVRRVAPRRCADLNNGHNGALWAFARASVDVRNAMLRNVTAIAREPHLLERDLEEANMNMLEVELANMR
jgi:hypothetical protein